MEGAVAEHAGAVPGQMWPGLGVGLPPGPALVVVGAGGRGVQGRDGGEGHGPFELPVSSPGCVLAVDRGPEDFVVGASPAQEARWAAVGKPVPSPTVTSGTAAVLTAAPASRSGPGKAGAPPAGH